MRLDITTASARFGLLLAVAASAASMMVLWGARIPGKPWRCGADSWIFVGGLLGSLTALGWLVRLTVLIFAGRLTTSVGPPSVGGLLLTGIPPLLFAATWGMIAVELPFRFAFAVSRSAMESTVHSTTAGNPVHGPRWIGLFPIKDVLVISDGLSLVIDAEDMLRGRRGFYYFENPARARGDATAERVTRLDEHWYFWQRTIW